MKNDEKGGKLKESKELALHYMGTLIAVARESFLILNSELRVISANEVFYKSFQVTLEQTENVLLYELGNGQWNIPELKKLLEEILPDKKVVKDYEVTHIFETIGEKTILLNARQIDSVQLIILAMEDISVKERIKRKLALKAEDTDDMLVERTAQLADKVKELESFNKTMVDRELKMVELKGKNKELKDELNKKS